jgi:hypothetical protein
VAMGAACGPRAASLTRLLYGVVAATTIYGFMYRAIVRQLQTTPPHSTTAVNTETNDICLFPVVR